jgi:hypothetical protein
MAIDIGTTIFIDILGMSQYPGSPFSGQIINDLVMFFFIPTVFIIIFVYILTGRLLGNAKLRLLLAIALYLFIVFGGYYSAFAYLAGPYFIFLIFILGALLFLSSHFGIRRSSQGGGLPASSVAGGAAVESHAQAAADLLNSIQVQCGVVEATTNSPDKRLLPDQIAKLGDYLTQFRRMKSSMKFSPSERAKFVALLAMHGANEKAITDQAEKLLKMKH